MSASYLPTDAASRVISVAAVPSAILDSKSFPADAIADAERVNISTMS